MKRPSLALVSALLFSGAALADAPRVATDIAPVHGLTARVMQGVGAPDLIVRRGASPHGYALRPSEAAALERADLVIWMGEPLTPWMQGAVATLAEGAEVIELLEVQGTNLLEYRETIKDHAHQETHADEADHDHHDHHGVDPHAWLDPENATLWLNVIAGALSDGDPENAAAYAANATAGADEIRQASAEFEAMLSGFDAVHYMVFHDAYQYLEARFGLRPAAAIALGDAVAPGAARLRDLRETMRAQGVTCVFSEPQFSSALIDTIAEGMTVKRVELDPMGTTLDTGPQFYPDLLRQMAAQMAKCL